MHAAHAVQNGGGSTVAIAAAPQVPLGVTGTAAPGSANGDASGAAAGGAAPAAAVPSSSAIQTLLAGAANAAGIAN